MTATPVVNHENDQIATLNESSAFYAESALLSQSNLCSSPQKYTNNSSNNDVVKSFDTY